MDYTKNDYTEYLNELTPDWESDEWIIGGKNRRGVYFEDDRYGEAIRKHDPVAFNVGYREWVREAEFASENA